MAIARESEWTDMQKTVAGMVGGGGGAGGYGYVIGHVNGRDESGSR